MRALLDTAVCALQRQQLRLNNPVSTNAYRNRREIGPNLDTVTCNKRKITQSLSSGLDQVYAFCAAIGERTLFGKGSWE